jgi:hypothetical protein
MQKGYLKTMTRMGVRHQHSCLRVEQNQKSSRSLLELLLLAQSLFASRVHLCNGLVDGLHRGANLRGFVLWKSLQRIPPCKTSDFYSVLTLPSSSTRPRRSRTAKLSSSDHDEEYGDGIWRNQTSDTGGREEPKWQAGDVFQDFYRLEAAINFSSAEENMGRAERKEVLQHFAKQRRRVYPDVRNFVLLPLVGAFGLSCLLNCPATRPFASLVTRTLDWHFWSAVVAAPIFLLTAKRLTMPPPAPMSDELKELMDSFYGVLEDWENRESSCRDHELFLLEYLTSSVVGMASVGCITLMTGPFPTNNKPVFLWLALSQFLTRMGALASLHQYSNQLFLLERKQQPRPLSLFGSLLLSLVRNVHKCGLIGIVSDFSKILVHLERDSLLALYATITISIAIFSNRLLSSTIRDMNSKLGTSLVAKFAYALVGAAIWKLPLSNLLHTLRISPLKHLVNQFKQGPLIVGLTYTATLLLILIPIVR